MKHRDGSACCSGVVHGPEPPVPPPPPPEPPRPVVPAVPAAPPAPTAPPAPPPAPPPPTPAARSTPESAFVAESPHAEAAARIPTRNRPRVREPEATTVRIMGVR